VYAFARTPKWIAAHVLALVAVVAFVYAAQWQWGKHLDRQARNALLEERVDAAPVSLDEALDDTAATGTPVDYRRVTVTGRFLADEEVLLSVRQHRGQPGHQLLTPLVTEDGEAVVVDRGWVPYELDDPPVAQAAPPEGEVTVTGYLFPSQVSGGVGIAEEGGDRVDYVGRVDIPRLQRQVEVPLAPAYLVTEDQSPVQTGELPIPAEIPPPDSGPYLNYTGQWSLFALVVLIGYPILLRKTAGEQAAERGANSGHPPRSQRDQPTAASTSRARRARRVASRDSDTTRLAALGRDSSASSPSATSTTSGSTIDEG
jgi:surfeit locus 1 family protein